MPRKVIDPANLAGRLKELRLTRKLSQGYLAKLAGIPQSIIAVVEGGERMPRYDTICALANALGVTLTELSKPAGRAIPPERPRGNPAWGKKADVALDALVDRVIVGLGEKVAEEAPAKEPVAEKPKRKRKG